MKRTYNKISTNNIPRPIITWYDLTEKEQEEEKEEGDRRTSSFFRYKGEICCLSDFIRIVPRNEAMGFERGVDKDDPLIDWHGADGGMVVKLLNYGEFLIVGSC